MTIVRQQTKEEKKDFIDISGLSPANQQFEIRKDLIRKFITRNRTLIIKSEDFEDFKELSCSSCFFLEHKYMLTEDDFKENFEKYS